MSQPQNPTFKPVQATAPKVFTGIPDFENDPNYELVKTFIPCAAYTSMVIIMIFAVAIIITGIKLSGEPGIDIVDFCCIGAFVFFLGIYSFLSIHYPNYLAGRPNPIKMWPVFLAILFFIGGKAYLFVNKKLELVSMILIAVGGLFACILQYFQHFGYDDTQSCWVKQKPWYYKRLEQPAFPNQFAAPPRV